MSACGRNEKPESTKPSGTVANEKETVKKTEKETEKATEKKTEAQTEDQTEKETETKETLSESESEAAATDENVLQLDAELILMWKLTLLILMMSMQYLPIQV